MISRKYFEKLFSVTTNAWYNVTTDKGNDMYTIELDGLKYHSYGARRFGWGAASSTDDQVGTLVIFSSEDEAQALIQKNRVFFTGAKVVKLPAPGKARQAEYAQRQRSLGRRQRSYWLDESESIKVADFIEKMRVEGVSPSAL